MNEQHLVVDHLYEVDLSDRSLAYQPSSDNVRLLAEIRENMPIQCSGLGLLAITLSAHKLDEEGVESLGNFLVIAQKDDQSLLATPEMIESRPDIYLTRNLARKIITLREEERAQLDLAKSTIVEMNGRYPNLRPLGKKPN